MGEREDPADSCLDLPHHLMGRFNPGFVVGFELPLKLLCLLLKVFGHLLMLRAKGVEEILDIGPYLSNAAPYLLNGCHTTRSRIVDLVRQVLKKFCKTHCSSSLLCLKPLQNPSPGLRPPSPSKGEGKG